MTITVSTKGSAAEEAPSENTETKHTGARFREGCNEYDS